MNILINDEKIDFTLDGEENCYDIIDGLDNWLKDQQYFISEFSLDGREFFIQNKDELKKYNLDDVNEIAVVALDKTQMALRDLDTVLSYFELYRQALKEGNGEVMTDLGSQYDSIKNHLPSLLMMNSYVFDTTLNKLMSDSGILEGTPSAQSQAELFAEWANVETLLRGRMGELSQPAAEGRKTVATLKRLIPRLEEVSVLFQSSKDKEALDIIIVLSELLSKSVRILSSLKERETEMSLPDDFLNELNTILLELAQAIETGDTILTGDLAEYEIVPKIETLETIFEALSGEELN